MPRVSAVITFLNSERFLAEAVRSVERQDFSDWELLLVDDGSQDGSRQIAERLQNHRIRLLSHPHGENRGISASRNFGVRHATGELIALLDSDDIWQPGKLRKQVAILDRHAEAAMVYGNAVRWYSWNSSDALDEVVWNTEQDRVVPPPEVLCKYLQDESMAPCTCTAVIRRNAYEAAAGFHEDFHDLYDDQVFFAKLLLRNAAYVMREPTAHYRQHERSTCAQAREAGTESVVRRRFLSWLLDYLPADEKQIRTIAEEELHRLPESVPPTHRANASWPQRFQTGTAPA